MQYLTEPEAIKAVIFNYSQAKILWLDTEVADYNTKQPKLSLIQVLDHATDIQGSNVTIIDVLNNSEIITEFINLIMVNSDIEKIFHNAKYDLKFLGNKQAKNVTCTLELAKTIPYHFLPLPNYQLKTIVEKLCHFPTIDKTEQASNWGQRPLTLEQLTYAKLDPVYVAQVHQKLLALKQLSYPNPETDDLTVLTMRYRQIQERWHALDSEMNHLKDRIKKAMIAQNLEEISGFTLASQKRTTKTVSFAELMRVSQANKFNHDFPITLTTEMQKELTKIINQLPIKVEEKIILMLKFKELQEEELDF